MTAGTDLDGTLLASALRHLQFKVIATGDWSLGQLMYTETFEPSVAPATGWVEELIPDVLTFDNGDTIQLGADRKHFEFTYPRLGLVTAADLTDMEAFIAAVSTYRPFLFDPPYDTNDAILMKLDDWSVRVNTVSAASDTRTAQVTLSMTEFIA
jgi:phage-related protein